MLIKNKNKLKKLGYVLKQDTADDAYQQVYLDDQLVFEGDDFRISNFINIMQSSSNLIQLGYDVEIIIKT